VSREPANGEGADSRYPLHPDKSPVQRRSSRRSGTTARSAGTRVDKPNFYRDGATSGVPAPSAALDESICAASPAARVIRDVPY